MKTAIYIEDGVAQLVITPESNFEKNALSTMREKRLDATIFDGAFYDCRGGWIRQTKYYDQHLYGINRESEDKSLIIRVNESPELDKDIEE